MIVVTTPTGNIGRELLNNLLADHGGEPVRVIARDPARLPASTRERVEVIEGSHGDRETVQRAFEGADSVFWRVPPDVNAKSLEAAYVDFTRPAAEAFQSRGVKRVVAVSALGRGTAVAAHAGLVTASLATDDLIAGTGVNFRALTMPSFMENLLNQAGALKNQGMFFSPLVADRKFPTCATCDIAAAAARLLRDPSEAFKTRLAGFGMSEAFVQGYADMMAAKNAGLDNAEPRTAENTSPTSFRQWCEEVLKPAVLN